MDSDFKSHHYAIVDLIEEGAMDAEQTTLDEHDDRVTDLSIRLQQLITRLSAGSIAPTAEASSHQILSKRFDRVEKKLKEVVDAVD